MRLNEQQQKMVINQFDKVWKGKRPCPVGCGKVDWGLCNIVEVKQYNDGNACPGTAITPMILIVCNTCGYSMMFNAIVMGLVDQASGLVKEAKP